MVSAGNNSRGRHRSLDAEVNLVPFIDLLSMCICFLLMTAVWVQIGALPVKQSRGTDAAPSATPFDLDIKLGNSGTVTLIVKKAGRIVKSETLSEPTVEAVLARLDGNLDGWLGSVLGIPPAQAAAVISSAMLTPNAQAPYGDMVGVMDIMRKHRIINLGVSPNTGAAR